MALYVLIRKSAEDDHSVSYTFVRAEQHQGRLQLDKRSGDVSELAATPGDQPHRCFMAAATNVRQHWRRGDFPDRTCWAS